MPDDTTLIFKPRSLPFFKKIIVETEIRRLLRQGVLVPETSPIMSAPIVPVMKSNGDIRLGGDYRFTVIDSGSYYLSPFNEIVQQLTNFDWFSKIDLHQA